MSTGPREQPTIHDVAALAGVSKSAVSRVLSGSGRFSDETRQRVQDAAVELGYVANAMARGLVSGRTNTIGMLVRDASSMLYAALHTVMERRAADYGYRVVTTTGVNRVEDEKSALSALVEMRVDGLVVCSGLLPASDIAEFAPRIATVVAGRPETHPLLSSVYCDEIDGGEQLADHVVDAGHRSVAVVGVPLDNAITQHARTAAMVARLRSRGVEVVEVEGGFARSASDIADELAAVRTRGVTAMMCANDQRMLDVSDALQSRGIRVPDDLSATGFDGVRPLDSAWIGVTTLRQPVEEIGRGAIELVMRGIDDRSAPVEHRRLTGRVIPGRTLRSPIPR